jgi:hypothetical protein
MRAERRVPVPRRSHPAVSTASCGRGARLPLPKTPERAILRPTTTGNPGNVGLELSGWEHLASAAGNARLRTKLVAKEG